MDSEIHLTEPLNAVRQIPLEARVEYSTALDRQATEKAIARRENRKESAEAAKRSDVSKAFGKTGAGAPIKKDGNVVTQPSKVCV